jgi:iron complex outermembrane receptor protein
MRLAFGSLGILLIGLTARAEPSVPEEVIITGTRLAGLARLDSPSPVQLVPGGALENFGAGGLAQDLAGAVPAFEAQSWGSGVGNNSLSARLRGLSPNDTLVLVDGKRRHGSANFQVLGGIYGGPFQGGAAPDLSFIPAAAIDHVEILTDGDSAQYGSDAVAGVVNIILRHDDHGGAVTAEAGQYQDQGGQTADGSAYAAVAPTPDSWLDLGAEIRYHAHSDRGGIDPRLANLPGAAQIPYYPRVNKIEGDAAQHLETLAVNGGWDGAGEWSLYGFGTFGRKDAGSYQNWRLPNKLAAVYPQGFSPEETIAETDFAGTLGVKGRVLGWSADLSTGFGEDHGDLFNIDSANVSLFNATGRTPTAMQTGATTATQWTTMLDLSRPFEIGMAGPLTVSFGAEARRDTYSLFPGDFASRYAEGSQALPGFSLTDAGRHQRGNQAGYLDLALMPLAGLQLDAAGRVEHFSDFGDAKVGKITARYQAAPGLALRGSVGNGFRAPTLVEEYYSATNVSPISASAQLPPDSAAARLLGIDPLRPELSRNVSFGLVVQPSSAWHASVDFYRIGIDRRIVGSGTVYGSGSPLGAAYDSAAVLAAIAANGNMLDPTVKQTGITVFSNGVDSRTQGLEGSLAYRQELGEAGRVDWSLGAAVNGTRVKRVLQIPAPILPQRLFDPSALSIIENEQPIYRFILGGAWALAGWRVDLRETVYGPSSNQLLGDDKIWYRNAIHLKAITDLSVAYDVTPAVTVTLGADNLFDVYPDKLNSGLLRSYQRAGDVGAVLQYPSFSPFGFDGGYYFGRLSYRF